MTTFQQAFEQLLSRAPGPVFPKARELYLRKYCLEATPGARFRTFLWREEIQEAVGGAVRVRALSFALVHWQGPQLEPHPYLAYLEERWQLRPDDLTLENDEPWFRDGGAWCRFTAAAVYERVSPAHASGQPRSELECPQAAAANAGFSAHRAADPAVSADPPVPGR